MASEYFWDGLACGATALTRGLTSVFSYIQIHITYSSPARSAITYEVQEAAPARRYFFPK